MSWIEDQGISLFGEYNMSALDIDQAWLNVFGIAIAKKTLWLYELSQDCYQCPFQRTDKQPVREYQSLITKIQTRFPLTYRLRTSGRDPIIGVNNDSDKFCDVSYNFGEFGVYELQAKIEGETPRCEIITRLEPVNIYLPLVLAALFYIILSALFVITSKYKQNILSGIIRMRSLVFFERPTASITDPLISSSANPVVTESPRSSSSTFPSKENKLIVKKKTFRFRNSRRTPGASSSGASEETFGSEDDISGNTRRPEESPDLNPLQRNESRKRVQFLDTFRGICIAMMIFVNGGGAGYAIFEHSSWDGLTIADVIFPWFLLCMGFSIPLNIIGQLKRNISKKEIVINITLRSFKLVFIGVVLNTAKRSLATDLALLRIPGVLQRFGLCYFVVAFLFLIFTAEKCLVENRGMETENVIISKFQDFKLLWIPWLIVLSLGGFYYIIVFFLAVPGCPKGYIGPAGLHNENAYPGICVGGAVGYIDRQLFSVNHIYGNPTPKSTYKCGAFDPEGALGLLTSILQIWIGLHAGVIMMMFPKTSCRLKRWFAMALFTGVLGTLLCEGKEMGGWIPINKNLWSISFVLVTTSMALILMCCLYFVVDVKPIWCGSPFLQCGMNSIALYVGHTIGNAMLPWNYSYGQMSTHFSRLVENLWGTSLWVIIAMYLYKKKMFYSI